jgi:hypothetical protein
MNNAGGTMNENCKDCGMLPARIEGMCFGCALDRKEHEITLGVERGELCVTCRLADKNGELPVPFTESTAMWVGGKYGRGTQKNVKRASKQCKHVSCANEVGISSLGRAQEIIKELVEGK